MKTKNNDSGRKLFPETTLILHIGLGKTGSSAIQLFLERNRSTLLSQGVCYPNHSSFYDRNSGVSSGNGVELMERLESSKGVRQNDLLEYLSADVAGGASKCLYSCEFFPNLDVSSVILLQDLFKNVKVTVYLRRQDLWLESVYKQLVRRGAVGSITDCEEMKPYYEVYADFRNILGKFSDVVGIENMIVRPYERKQFSGGCLYLDFVEALGLSWQDCFEVPERKINVSYSREVVLLKEMLNRVPESVDLDRWLSRYCERANGQDGGAGLYSCHERLRLLKRYQESNREVARVYLQGSKEMLFRDIPSRGKDAMDDPTPERFVEIFASVATDIIKEHNQSSKEVRSFASKFASRARKLIQRVGRR